MSTWTPDMEAELRMLILLEYRAQRAREVVDTLSRECRFDGRANEPRCRGCMK